MVWGSMIAWYLFLAGTSAGMFVATSVIDMKFAGAKKITLPARLTALVAIAIGLILLMLDAEAGFSNPLRFFLLVANPASVMTLGVYAICVYLVVLAIALVLDFLKKDVPKTLSIVGIAVSVCVAAYTGFLLGVATSYPLWNNAALPVLFVVSGLSAGFAATALVGRFADGEKLARIEFLSRSGVVFPVIEGCVLFCMLVLVAASSPEGAESVVSMLSGQFAAAFWGALVLVGIIAPLCIEAYSLKSGSEALALGGIANVGVLVGGFALRYLVVAAAVVVLCV